METILKILEYTIYGLLAVIAIMIPILFYCKYMEAKFSRQRLEEVEAQLTDAQSLLFRAGEALGEMEKDRDKWKKMATVPVFPTFTDPKIYTHTPDTLESRSELFKFNNNRDIEILKYKAMDLMLKRLKPYISEKEEGGYYFLKAVIYKEK